jgi:membrane-bound metal-dependent hydrolase YbcI (DUF457 family)
MPDALTHYASSYLVPRAALKPKQAALAALAGLLPDLDALLRIHRWATHSLVLALAAAAPILLALRLAKNRHLHAAALVAALYALHITLDALTSPTPALWPLAPSLQVKIEVNGRMSTRGPALAASAAVATSPTDFTRKPYVEGPLMSETGLALAATTLAVTAAERAWDSEKAVRGRADGR